MAKDYDNTNRGVLFLNDRKEKDSHPDRKGSINIDGKEYWLSGWDKVTAKGDTISLSIQAKDDAPKAAQRAGKMASAASAAKSAAPDRDEHEDDMPF